MKKYFAKYLPVEGEIKEGDIALKPAAPSIGINEPYIEDVGVGELDYGKSYMTNAKKLKLFLCSRDIQVGDKIVADYIIDGTSEGLGMNHIQKQGTINKEEFGDHWEITSEIGREYARKDGCFKVIGEISPDATWVKEGDEFTEDEILHYMYTEEDADIGEPSFVKYKNFNHNLRTTHPEIYKRWREVYKVKGPCGHFH